MQCLPPNVISTVAEHTSKFAMNEPTFDWRKKNKKRGKREFPNSMMKDINPFRQNNNNKKKYVLLRMVLGFSSSDTMMERPTLPEKKIFAGKSAR
ncbi:hypothetical protein TNCV_2310881 [Trichonephila clavipes]|nr:hypothetical protein TNCV_2310881 [Trichonephila clavipes]